MKELNFSVSKVVITSNLTEVSEAVDELVEMYSDLIVREDSIQSDKKLRASLNKVTKQINDVKIQVKKTCLEDYMVFENFVKEIISRVDGVKNHIDEQLKEFESEKKLEKLNEIKEYVKLINHPLCDFESVFEDCFLNKTVSMDSIKLVILKRIDKVDNDLKLLRDYPEAERLMVIYKDSGFDLATALQEQKRIELEVLKLKENKPVEAVVESQKIIESSFHVMCEESKLKRLVQFMKDNDIIFESIK